jgi:Tfp pilus assembly protein FimT
MRRLSSDRGYTMMEVLTITAILGVLAAFSLPMTTRAVNDVRLRGDARAVSNVVSLAKMRAASAFTRARVFVDLSSDTFFVQIWDRQTETWTTEGAVINTSDGVSFGFAGLGAPPPDTQTVISQSAPCTNDDGDDIGNTACIVFNSRGIPIDADGAPTGENGLYITDGLGVYATTLTATPLINLWWSPASATNWVKQ